MVTEQTWDPVWVPPVSIDPEQKHVAPFSQTEENPLGVARMRLSGEGAYALHGTNAPNSIGHSVSHGCIRHRNEDVAVLMQYARKGTPVYFVDDVGLTNVRASDFTFNRKGP